MEGRTREKPYEVAVIGCGEIGGGILREISETLGKENVFGCDVSKKIVDELKGDGYDAGRGIPLANNYIISVYTTGQLLDVVKKIPLINSPLISLELTDEPGTFKKAYEYLKKESSDFDLFCFPHRYNPRDPEHKFFNLHRIAGAYTRESLERGLRFYAQFMDPSLIHIYPVEIVELSKPLENSYRFIDIAIAEELKMVCDERGIDFELLRSAMNTKWNVEILEARDGIGGKCLPKDSAIISNYFKNFNVLSAAIESDAEYKGFSRKSKKFAKWVILGPILAFAVVVVVLLANRLFVNTYLSDYMKVYKTLQSSVESVEGKEDFKRLDVLDDAIDQYLSDMVQVEREIQIKKSLPGMFVGRDE